TARPVPRRGLPQDFYRHATFPTSNPGSSEYPAQHFAADLGGAGLVVRHDPARGRQDGDAETVIDPRQVGQLRIDSPARFRDPRDLLYHRLAIDIFQLDFELGDAGAYLLSGEAADIAFPLQDFEDIRPDLRGRRG